MKKCFVFIYIGFILPGLSQFILFENRLNKDSIQFISNVSYDLQSTAATNDFLNKIFVGGEINVSDKKSILSKHKELNKIGQEYQAEIIFSNFKTNFLKHKNFTWIYNAGYKSLFAGNYSKDFLSLALNGNTSYLGDTLKFKGSKFSNQTFQYLGFGIQDKKTLSYFTMNAVNYQSHFNGNLDGYFYTSEDTTQLALKTKGELNSSFKSKTSNGIGFSINSNINIEIPLFGEKESIFQLKIRDFGIAKINPISSYRVDTTIAFNGFEIQDLFQLSKSKYTNQDWFDTLNVKSDTISKWVVLPVMLQFSKLVVHDSISKFQTFFGIKTYPTLTYFPKVFLGLDYKFTAIFFGNVSASYGGFGGFRSGLYFRYVTKKIFINIGTEDIYGLISKKGFGRNINLSLLCNF